MISQRTHVSSLLAVLAASSGLLVACNADPIGGGSGGGGGDDDTTVVSTSTGTDTSVGGNGSGGDQATSTSSTGGGNAVGGGPAAYESVAMYGDQIPESGSGGGSSSVGVGGSDPGFEDDRLFLFVSNGAVLCSDPFTVDENCPEEEFKAIIGLPVEYQQPGTYDLDDPAITASFSEWGPDGDGSCFGGGGSFFDGTIEIVGIESDRVRLVLAGTSPSNLDGQHAAFFCGAEPPPEESSVIGYYPSDLPPPESGSSGTTGGGGDERFILVFADHAQSCADPFGNQPGPGELHEELVIRLPDSYLVPGTYDLADPMIEADSFYYEENSAASGGGGVVGTLVIHEVTDTTIDLELSGTPTDFANVAAVVPRCGG